MLSLNFTILLLSLVTAFSGSAAAPVPSADTAQMLSRRGPTPGQKSHHHGTICYPRKAHPGARRPSQPHPGGGIHRRNFDRTKVGQLLGFHGTRRTEGEVHNQGHVPEHKGTGGTHLGGELYVASHAAAAKGYAESSARKHNEEPALCFVYAANDAAWLAAPKAWLNDQKDASMASTPELEAKLTEMLEKKRAKTAQKAGATEDATTEFVRFSHLVDDKQKVTEGETQFALTHELLTKRLVVLHCHIGEAAITAAMATPEGRKVFHYNGADATSWNVKGIDWLEKCN